MMLNRFLSHALQHEDPKITEFFPSFSFMSLKNDAFTFNNKTYKILTIINFLNSIKAGNYDCR